MHKFNSDRICFQLLQLAFSWGFPCRNWSKYQISHVVRIIINVIIIIIYSYCWPCWPCTWINIYFKLKSGVLFWKRDFKSSRSAYSGQAYDQKKIIRCQDTPFLWNSWIFFSVSWHHDKQHSKPQTVLIYTQDPPVTHRQKLNQCLCTSS